MSLLKSAGEPPTHIYKAPEKWRNLDEGGAGLAEALSCVLLYCLLSIAIETPILLVGLFWVDRDTFRQVPRQLGSADWRFAVGTLVLLVAVDLAKAWR